MRNWFRKNKCKCEELEERIIELERRFCKKPEPVNQVYQPSVDDRFRHTHQNIEELRYTLFDLIYQLGLEEDHSCKPRRHVFRKRNAKREK